MNQEHEYLGEYWEKAGSLFLNYMNEVEKRVAEEAMDNAKAAETLVLSSVAWAREMRTEAMRRVVEASRMFGEDSHAARALNRQADILLKAADEVIEFTGREVLPDFAENASTAMNGNFRAFLFEAGGFALSVVDYFDKLASDNPQGAFGTAAGVIVGAVAAAVAAGFGASALGVAGFGFAFSEGTAYIFEHTEVGKVAQLFLQGHLTDFFEWVDNGIDDLFTENPKLDNGVELQTENAFMYRLLLHRLDKAITPLQTDEILELVSNEVDKGSEELLKKIEYLITGNRNDATIVDDEAYFGRIIDALIAIGNEPIGTISISNVSGNPGSLVTQAQRKDALGLATRYALKELNPFILKSNSDIYARHNTNQELDLFDPATGEGSMTKDYLEDRAAFLWWKNTYGIANATGPGSTPGRTYIDKTSGLELGAVGTGGTVGDPSEIPDGLLLFGRDLSDNYRIGTDIGDRSVFYHRLFFGDVSI